MTESAKIDSPRPTRAKRGGKGPVSSFIERSLGELTSLIERDLVLEEQASRPGLLQKLDPRAKLLGALGLIVAIALVRHLPVLVAAYFAILAIGLIAKLPAGLLLGRVWLALPFFTAVVALPAIFSVVTPGPVVLSFGKIGGTEIALSAPGLRTALTLVFRVAGSVTALLLLVLTTRWPTLLKALSVLRLPDIIILILAMTYRYIFLLVRVASSMLLARKSRTVGPSSGARTRQLIASTTGVLLGKSYHLSSEVYLAMLSRGFRGEGATLEPLRIGRNDYLALLGAVALAALIYLADRLYLGPW